MASTFESVRKIAEGPDAPGGMYHYTMSAAENANDTVFVGKAAHVDQWDSIALASLESILADGIDPDRDDAARSFFSGLGVRF